MNKGDYIIFLNNVEEIIKAEDSQSVLYEIAVVNIALGKIPTISALPNGQFFKEVTSNAVKKVKNQSFSNSYK